MKRTQEIKKTYPELNQSKITENKSDKKNIRSTGGTGKDIFITGKMVPRLLNFIKKKNSKRPRNKEIILCINLFVNLKIE